MITQHLSIDQMKDSMRAPWIAGDFGAIAREQITLFLAVGIVPLLAAVAILALGMQRLMATPPEASVGIT